MHTKNKGDLIKLPSLLHSNHNFFHNIWRDKYLLLMLVPMVVLLFIFSYVPMYGILISFQDYQIGKPFLDLNGGTHWVGLYYFIKFFKSIFFLRTLKNTVLISVYMLVFGFWFPIAFALILNEIKHKVFKRTVQTLSYLPYFISTVIIVGIVINMLSSVDGIINNFIVVMGGTPVQFLNEPKYFRAIYTITSIWQTFGWGSVLYLANIATIDQSLYEAAKIDGANRWQQICHITIPGIKPTITILLIFSIGGLLSTDTEKIFLLYNPAVYDTADVIGTYTIREGVYGANYSYASAIGLVSTVVNFSLLVLANKFSKKVNDYGLW